MRSIAWLAPEFRSPEKTTRFQLLAVRETQGVGDHTGTRRLTRGLASLLTIFGLALAVSTASAEPSPARRMELLNLLRQDCGACHGYTLKGGLGPPLLPGTLDSKPADFLIASILYGRPGTPMPPWRPFLSADEATWLVRQLQEGVK